MLIKLWFIGDPGKGDFEMIVHWMFISDTGELLQFNIQVYQETKFIELVEFYLVGGLQKAIHC